MKHFISSIFIFCALSFVSAQNTVAKIKYQQAEEAYNKNDFRAALSYIEEVERLMNGTSTTILFLKILTKDKLIEPNPWASYDALSSLRQDCGTFMKTAEGDPELEDRFKEVYFISEKYKSIPKTKAEFDTVLNAEKKKAEEQERIRLQKVAEEQRRLEAEQKRLAAEAEANRQRELRNISFGTFRIGYAHPLNAVSKSLMTYPQWSSDLQGPISVPFKNGRFNLVGGIQFGMTGIVGLEKLNSILYNRIGVGISLEMNESFLFYNWKDLAKYNSDTDWLFENATYSPFWITSIGVGPSFSYRISDKKQYFDFYVRENLNLLAGGKYKNTYYSEIISDRDIEKIRIAPAIGLAFRDRNTYYSIDFRLGLLDNSQYTETIDGGNLKSFQANLNLNNIGFTIGTIF